MKGERSLSEKIRKEIEKDDELMKESRELTEALIEGLVEDPQNVWKVFEDFESGFLNLIFERTSEYTGTDIETVKSSMENIPEDKKNKLVEILEDDICTLETMFLTTVPKNIENDFAESINYLYEECEKENPEELKKIFRKSRIPLFRKLYSSFKRGWKDTLSVDIPKEAQIDNKFRAAKTISEGIYRPLLKVIQEMMQISYSYSSVDRFGVIIDQMKGRKETENLINELAYDIRNAESHENSQIGERSLDLYDRENKLIRTISEEDLEDTIKWLINFAKSVVYSLQEKYLKTIKIGQGAEERMKYLTEEPLEKLLFDFDEGFGRQHQK